MNKSDDDDEHENIFTKNYFKNAATYYNSQKMDMASNKIWIFIMRFALWLSRGAQQLHLEGNGLSGVVGVTTSL